jgi:hypothetical protein
MTNLARSREELDAARNLANSGFPRRLSRKGMHRNLVVIRYQMPTSGVQPRADLWR